MLTIKTNNEDIWFEIESDKYNYMLYRCERKIIRNPKTKEESIGVSKDKWYPANMIELINIILKKYSRDVINQVNDLKLFMIEYKKIKEEIISKIEALSKK